MITELSAQNFKSWEDTGTLQFAPLTGFFGANSSGKTSILQVLLMLKQTVGLPREPRSSPREQRAKPRKAQSSWNEPLYFGDEQSLVNLGNFDAIVHRHKQGLSLRISMSWKIPEQINIEGNLTDSLSFSTSIQKHGLNSFRYTVGEHNFEIARTPEGYMFKSDRLWKKPFRCYGVDDPSETLESFLPLEKTFEDLFSRIRYLGPRREDPRRHYKWEESHPNDVGQYGEKMISALLSSRVRLRSTDEQIMKWLQRLELIYSYDLNSTSNTEQDYELLVQQYKDGPKVGLTDVGFGVSQVLPLLALCYYADEGSILIIEQPEAHLHPKVQSDLADVLIDVAKNRNIQIILESHSEHQLHRLTRRIAEERISANDMALYFCKIDDGTSTAEKLKVDDYGNISNWPQNFFGDEMGDLAAKARAEIKRKKANKQ